jgi:hypothetical protein
VQVVWQIGHQRACGPNGVWFPVSDGVDIRLAEKSANLATSDRTRPRADEQPMTATSTRLSTVVEGCTDELSDGRTVARELPGFGCCGWSTTPTRQPLQSALSNYRTGGDRSPPVSLDCPPRPRRKANSEVEARKSDILREAQRRRRIPSLSGPGLGHGLGLGFSSIPPPRLSNISCHLRP